MDSRTYQTKDRVTVSTEMTKNLRTLLGYRQPGGILTVPADCVGVYLLGVLVCGARTLVGRSNKFRTSHVMTAAITCMQARGL